MCNGVKESGSSKKLEVASRGAAVLNVGTEVRTARKENTEGKKSLDGNL